MNHPKRVTGAAKPTKQQRTAARMLARGANFTDSLIAAGYSPAQARKGLARVVKSKGLMDAIRDELAKFPPDVRAGLVRLRLIQNLLTGEDRATKSAQLLGRDKEVNMWQADPQQQTLVIQAPSGWYRNALMEITEGEKIATAPLPPPSERVFPDYD